MGSITGERPCRPVRLSIVVPAYNEADYIGACLQSILEDAASGGNDVEVIVVNNASTDATGNVALSYKGVKVIEEPKKGIVCARQAGYLAATGDLIANVDADNVVPRGWTAQVLREFSRNDNLVAFSGPLVYHDLSLLVNFQVRTFYLIGYVTYLINHFILRKSGMLQGGNFIVRRAALEAIGGYDTTIDFYGEDTDIARRMQSEGYVKFTFQLKMYSSGRRMAKEGILTTGFKYALNYLWILVYKKPFNRTSTDIRIGNKKV